MPSKVERAIKEELADLDERRKKLERMLGELGGSVSRSVGRPKGSKSRRSSRNGGPTRGRQVLDLVRSQPGITPAEMARAMGIAPNYVYRLVSEHVGDGSIRKVGRGYHASANQNGADADQQPDAATDADAAGDQPLH